MIDRFEKSMGMKAIPAVFENIYAKALAEYEKDGVFFLKKDYIVALNEETEAYPTIVNELIAEANIISADREAALYALFVYRAMENRELFLQNIKSFVFPEEKYFFFAFFCIMPSIKSTFDTLNARGIPLDIVKQTVGQYEACVYVYEKRFDRLGFNKRYFDHMQLYVDCKILNIGRLRFEIIDLCDPIRFLENKNTGEQVILFGEGEMRADGLYASAPPASFEGNFNATFTETETEYIGNAVSVGGRCEREVRSFSKSEWTVRAKQHDTCISVHIPDKGALTEEACVESYHRALDTFKKYYPELDIKCFHCHSWMLAPELADMMKPESKILGFARRYVKYPVPTDGDDVMNFVFYLKAKEYKDLPEDTSLQRSLKQLYLSGGYLYEYGGLFTEI